MIKYIKSLDIGGQFEINAILARKINEIIGYINDNEIYIGKDKIRKVIKKYYDEYEKEKRYRYTLDVEAEQSVLKDIEKELLEGSD